LEEIRNFCSDSKKASSLISKRAVSLVRDLLFEEQKVKSDSTVLTVKALKALEALAVSECAIQELLYDAAATTDSSQPSLQLNKATSDFLSQMIVHSDKEVRSAGISLVSRLSEKCEPGSSSQNIVSHIFRSDSVSLLAYFSCCQPNSTRPYGIHCFKGVDPRYLTETLKVDGKEGILAIPSSVKVNGTTNPCYVSLDTRKSKKSGRISETSELSSSFWLFVNDECNAECMPVFYKGRSLQTYFNSSMDHGILLCFDHLIRSGRKVFLEWTLNANTGVKVKIVMYDLYVTDILNNKSNLFIQSGWLDICERNDRCKVAS
jgi:hypothetical protein